MLEVTLGETTTEQVVRGYRGQPARQVVQVHYHLTVARNAGAIRQARRLLGWSA